MAGSSNFDFMSHHILEELVVMTRDPAMVGGFVGRIWRPDAARAVAVRPRSSVGTRWGHAAVRAGEALARRLALP